MAHDIQLYEDILEEIASKLPDDFFEKLTGGILLLEETKLHPKSGGTPLYILGEYHRDMSGRHIRIYYGSFERVHGQDSEEQLKRELEHTLMHEFRHHFESLAGLRDLEVEDENQILDYMQRRHPRRG